MGEFEYRILSDDTEEQLIDWAKQGNQAAFELLLKKYRPRMFSWVSKLTHSLKLDITDVNDVVQEASIKAWINIRNFRGESQLSTWLYTITFHQAINLSHKNNRYSNTHRFSDIEAQYARNGDYGEKHDLFDMAIDIDMPEDIFAAKEVQKKVQQIIEDLPKSLREVIPKNRVRGGSGQNSSENGSFSGWQLDKLFGPLCQLSRMCESKRLSGG